MWIRGGHAISIESRPATPAGWYTDPAGTGGKRWWDGVQWTSNLQAPPAPTPSAAVVSRQPQRADPYANPNPYANPGPNPYLNSNQYGAANPYGVTGGYGTNNHYVGGAGNPVARDGYLRVPMQQVHQQHNSAAIGSVVVGAVAFCLSLVGLVPGSPVFYYSVGGIFAIIGGARALARRRQGYGTNMAAPVIAIVLGSLAVIFMIAGIMIHSTLGYNAGTTSTTGTSSNAGSQVSGGTNDGESTAKVPAAPTFASDANLTAYEQTAGNVALSVDQFSNGGFAFDDHGTWPAALTVMSDGTILLPPGTSAGHVPVGQHLRYVVSADEKSFEVIVSGDSQQEFAIYDSTLNAFTWSCVPADTTCPPGGVSGDSGGSSGTATNS